MYHEPTDARFRLGAGRLIRMGGVASGAAAVIRVKRVGGFLLAVFVSISTVLVRDFCEGSSGFGFRLEVGFHQ